MVNGMIRTSSVPTTQAKDTATARVRAVDVSGPAGRLEAVLNEGREDAPVAVLLCHPHPLGGGNLHNKVVYHAMKAINAPDWELGWPVLRFNFRGTGRSEGVHHGSEEAADVAAGLDWLRAAFGLPVVLVGFSFGAAMSLASSCAGHPGTSSGLIALAALGLPLHAGGRSYSYPFLTSCSIPKLFLSGDRDQFAPAAELEAAARAAANPREIILIPGADHFFTGQLPAMQAALRDWLQETV